jgi:hypothetical protein
VITASRRRNASASAVPGRIRGGLLAAVLATLALLAPAPASAHGGYQMMAVTNGAYSVTVRARPFMVGKQSKVDVTSYVVRQDIGESDLNAKVQLRLSGPDGTLNLTPPLVGDGYEAIINAGQTAWRHWTIVAHVTGAAGSSTVSGGPVGDPPGAPLWLIPASVVVVAIAAVLFVLGRRRRAARPDDDEEDDDWLVPA